MQVGAPMDLFNYPENKFVAGFLGSPKMNFFECKLVSENGAKTLGKWNLMAIPRTISDSFHEKRRW